MQNDFNQEKYFAADRPIKGISNDQLGFRIPAKHVANAILEFASPEGFVLGLEGEWGTGKSSFINLISQHFEESDNPPEIVQFSPWLISSREALLIELFQEIALAAEKIDDSHSQTKTEEPKNWKFWEKQSVQDKNKLKSSLSKYSKHLALAGKVATLAGDLGLPGGGLAGRALEGSSKVGADIIDEPPLEKQKEQIKTELRKLPRQIVVFVDDLDRLEPQEAGEVVRLVRAVADFPNIIYVLCYSRRILTDSLNKAFQLEEGDDYIDKIVQVSFSVPKPEDFALRRMFRKELSKIFPNINQSLTHPTRENAMQRMGNAIDIQGGDTLKSPRDVVRTLNAMRLYAGPVIDHIDLADMAWLQLIRIRNRKLYEWIESYVNNIGAIVNEKGQLKEAAKKRSCDELIELIKEEGRDVDDTLYHMNFFLPGLKKEYKNKPGGGTSDWVVYADLNDDSLAQHIAEMRLGSPKHFRYYFAFTKPKNAVSDSDYSTFVSLLNESKSESISQFSVFCETRMDSGTVLAESYMNRIRTIDLETFSIAQSKNIISCLAESMDIAALVTGRGDWGRYWIWNDAKKLFNDAFKAIPQAIRGNVLKSMFLSGTAIGWLSVVLRNETFDHGRQGDSPKHEEERLMTSDQLDSITDLYLNRLKVIKPEDIIEIPNFSNAMYAWLQGSAEGKKEIRKWLAGYIKTDIGLLKFLNSMRGWTASSIVYYPLRKNSIEDFVDYKEARNRVEKIADNGEHPDGEFAKEILLAFEQGDERF